MSSSQYIIETHFLSYSFGSSQILKELNIRVPPASIYGFLGPNGAGKSTTLRVLLGLLPVPTGVIQLFEQDLNHNRLSLLSRVGALIEMPSLYDHLSGYDNLEVTRRLRGLPAHRTAEVLTVVRLAGDARRLVRDYSLGMRQRLGLALALLPDPELLILDEPTNGLDPNGIIEMRELLMEMRQEYGKTILISSHLISEVERIATHVGVIQQGHLVFQGTLSALQEHQIDQKNIIIETNDAVYCRQIMPLELRAATILSPSTLSLPYQSPEHTAGLAQKLVEAGQPLYALRCQQPSLEQTFLDLTATKLL